jgi:hypothetical protein
MASRSQIDRLSRSIERIAAVVCPRPISHVPIYEGEAEAEALAAYREEFDIEPRPGSIVFNKGRPGDARAACMASGMHAFHCLGPSEIRQVLAAVDGKTRGIPTTCETDK